ncbi:MAG: hypothetical protein QW478_01480 [Candidatus Micrarchaeaceae archaeon]
MGIFPLYDKLTEKIKGVDSSKIGPLIKSLPQTIEKLSKQHLEQLTLLIIHHYIVSTNDVNVFINYNSKNKKNFPYGIKISPSGKAYSLNLENLPITLQLIILAYFSLIK